MNYALLIARQRSGTGALGSVLDKHPDLKYVGEVFHPQNVGQRDNFFTFKGEYLRDNSTAWLPDEQYGVFEAFLAYLQEFYPGRTLVIDVKYRSFHQLNGGWLGLDECPTLLARAMQADVPILHLTRKNFVQSFVSGRLAEANRVWHARDTDKIDVTSVAVNIRQLSNYIVGTKREVDLIGRWTQWYSRIATFDYGEMFDDAGLIDPSLCEKIAATMGIGQFEDRAPSFLKQAPSRIEDALDNYDLVKHALEGTEFRWMLD